MRTPILPAVKSLGIFILPFQRVHGLRAGLRIQAFFAGIVVFFPLRVILVLEEGVEPSYPVKDAGF